MIVKGAVLIIVSMACEWVQTGHAHAYIIPVLLPPTREVEVTEEDGESAEDGEDDRKDARGRGDRKRGVGHGDGDGAPCANGGGGKGAMLGGEVDDARVCLGEKNEHAWSEEDGDQGTDTLCDPLQFWWRSE